MFGVELAEVYDLVYSERGQNFAAEAHLVTGLVRDRAPAAATLLDVGCGTGEHLVTLAERFDHVEGIDLAEPMVAVARAKLPDVTVHLGDMTDFDLSRTYDAVISLSTAVAYLPSADAMGVAVKNMVSHLAPGGVLIVEPWYFPENYLDGHIATDIVRGAGRTISRVSRSREQDGATHIESHWVVTDAAAIRHFTETHVFGLWTHDQYDAAFASAGCTVEYVPEVQAGRGLLVARRC